jgi:hypothetical protein
MQCNAKCIRVNWIVGGIASIALLAGATGAMAQSFDHSHAAFNALLKAHVSDGQVNYRALKAAPAALNGYLDTLAAVREPEFKTWSEAQQIAFLANLYNAATLKLIVALRPLGGAGQGAACRVRLDGRPGCRCAGAGRDRADLRPDRRVPGGVVVRRAR